MMKNTCNSSICTGSSAVHHSIIEPSINIHVSNMSRRPHACALQPIQVINYGSNSRSNTFKYFIYYLWFPRFHWCYFQFFNIFRCSTLLHHSQMVVKCVQFFLPLFDVGILMRSMTHCNCNGCVCVCVTFLLICKYSTGATGNHEVHDVCSASYYKLADCTVAFSINPYYTTYYLIVQQLFQYCICCSKVHPWSLASSTHAHSSVSSE